MHIPAPALPDLPHAALRARGLAAPGEEAAMRTAAPPARPLPEHLETSLWRGDQMGRSAAPTCPSGFAALDAELPGGGWPTAALTELLLAQPGQGELRLLAPVCAQLAGRPVLWIAPPHRPYTPALQSLGLTPAQLLWVTPAQAADAAWAAEQAIKSRSCAAVLWWAPQARPEQLRRLHLAAQGCDSLLFVLRPAHSASQSSPAPLRVQLQADAAQPGSLVVHLLKRRGPAREAPLHLDTRGLFAPALARRLQRALPQWPVPTRVPVRTASRTTTATTGPRPSPQAPHTSALTSDPMATGDTTARTAGFAGSSVATTASAALGSPSAHPTQAPATLA